MSFHLRTLFAFGFRDQNHKLPTFEATTMKLFGWQVMQPRSRTYWWLVTGTSWIDMRKPLRNSDETWQDVLRFTSDCQGYSAIWQSWEPRMRYYDIVYWFWWNSLEFPENRDVSNRIQQLLRRARMLRRSSTAKAGSLSYTYPVKCPHWSNASACGWTTAPNLFSKAF